MCSSDLYLSLSLSLFLSLSLSLSSVKPRKGSLAHKHLVAAGAHGTCRPCPVIHPSPVCGSDGHTYSSKVRRPHLPSLSLPLSLSVSLAFVFLGPSFLLCILFRYHSSYLLYHLPTVLFLYSFSFLLLSNLPSLSPSPLLLGLSPPSLALSPCEEHALVITIIMFPAPCCFSLNYCIW